jgi:hypothetical protein
VPLSSEAQQRVIQAITERMGPSLVCPMCRKGPWSLAEGYVTLLLQDSALNLKLSGPALPTVSITCQNCGYTALLNLYVLGLSDLVITETTPEDQSSVGD